MKNYYAILEVPVGCGVADIRQAYRRLVQDNLDNEAVFAELKEAHEVLTTPSRRADYDRAVWGETFMAGGADGATLLPNAATLLPGAATLLPGAALPVVADTAGGGHCPMGAAAHCPVLLGRTGPADTYCPECGFLLVGLNTADTFEVPEADAVGTRLEETSGRSHRLRVGLNIVGREGADVLLPDKTVSRQHARLEVSGDGATVTVEDMGSTNGTQVGGEVLVPHMARTLQAGDRVRFGSVITELHVPGEAAAAPAEPSIGTPLADLSPPPPLELVPRGPARAQVVETREEGGRTFPLPPGATTFGRRADNTVIIQGDPYVSGSHAQIVADGDVFRLTDVGSTNGTLLNGRRLAIGEPETLTPADVILIGGTAMRFELLDVPEAAPNEDAPSEEVPAENVTSEQAPAEDTPAAAAPPMALAPPPAAAPAAPPTADGTIELEPLPGEPRARTAQEYDVPDDEADNGVPTRAAHPHDASVHDTLTHDTHDSQTHDSQTQVER